MITAWNWLYRDDDEGNARINLKVCHLRVRKDECLYKDRAKLWWSVYLMTSRTGRGHRGAIAEFNIDTDKPTEEEKECAINLVLARYGGRCD